MLASAQRQTARIVRLSQGLLDLDRIDSAGQLRLDRQLHPARRLVQDSLSYLRTAELVREIDEELMICVDRQRFEQIVVNLAGNAVKYGRSPVAVRITRDGELDRPEVRDHGPGIPDELRPRLFSRSAAVGEGGVGLGLWIKQMAEAHGGTVMAEAREPGLAMW